MKTKITDITTNTSYPSVLALSRSLYGENANEYTIRFASYYFTKNVKNNNGKYVCASNNSSPLKALNGHEFKLEPAVGHKKKQNVITSVIENNDIEDDIIEDDCRIIINTPIKNYRECTNARINKTWAKALESVGIEISSNNAPVLDEKTKIIYSTVATAAREFGKKSNTSEDGINVIQRYITKSCKYKVAVAVEKNRNGSGNIIASSGIGGRKFSFISDHKVTEIPQIIAEYKDALTLEYTACEAELAALRQKMKELEEEKHQVIIKLDGEMASLKTLESVANARFASIKDKIK